MKNYPTKIKTGIDPDYLTYQIIICKGGQIKHRIDKFIYQNVGQFNEEVYICEHRGVREDYTTLMNIVDIQCLMNINIAMLFPLYHRDYETKFG